MKAQLYRIKRDDLPTDDYPVLGAFIFNDNNDDMVRGFISEATDEYSEFCLWEPTDIDPKYEVVEAELSQADVLSKLNDAVMNASDIVKSNWSKLLREAEEDVDTAG